MKPRNPTSVRAPLGRPAWQTYGFSAVLLGASLGMRWLLDPLTGDLVPLATMYIAVVYAVWYGGWRPATLLAITGYFSAIYFFVHPRFVPKLWGDFGAVRCVLYFISCTVVIYLCESLRRTRIRHAASELKVASILENMREGFFSIDHEGMVTALNRSAEAILGASRDSIIGRPLWDILPNRTGSSIETELQRALRDGVSVQFETNVLSPGKWHAVNATHVDHELAIFFQDVTATHAHVDQLERLVDDRTAALQRVISDLEAFSYTLVHDMRAPLRSISGFAELLASDHATQLDQDGQRHLSRIQRSAATMDRLIMDILDYSQLSRNPPQLGSVDLDRTLRDILRSHDEFLPEKADIHIDAPLPMVRGNDAILTQCFSNLLLNAAKFVAPGIKPRIRISNEVRGDLVRVDITDNGIGIPPEATLRIFEPFRREHANYEGTGIGLAIVQKVIDQLGGRVGVESTVGHGSRFWVELKLTSNSPEPKSEFNSFKPPRT